MHFDPRLSGLGALGVECVSQLLGDGGAPLQRAEQLASIGSRERLRFPLPGTPERPGAGLTGEPEGAGTGWVVLERWRHAPLRSLFRSRLTSPRSASLAERRWNLLCHLRAHGVGTRAGAGCERSASSCASSSRRESRSPRWRPRTS